MCGICGVAYYAAGGDSRPGEELREQVSRMCQALAHRGPDGQGIAVLGQAALGHRRLIVIDPATGAQPIYNEDRSIAIVFNGEIYNFRDLRRQLESRGHVFSTDHSDTETIVHLYEERGVDCLHELRGMFAFAIWDSRRQRLFLARDRVGKKPLYYAEADGALWFGSEMKALLQAPCIGRTVNPDAIHDFLTHQYVPPPQTIYREISKLPQAHYLVWENGRARVERYWQLQYEPKASITREEAMERTETLVNEAVRLRLESDVPLGCFLSGGVDSSLVVAMMRRHVTGPLRTFSIGFEEAGYNELPYAREVAERFGTEHHELIVRADAGQLLPKLAWHFDEPYADMSAVPTYYLAEMARRDVTVALNGDGGDESFAGYERYRDLPVFRRWGRVPEVLRATFAHPARVVSRRFPESAFLANVRYVNDVTLSDPAWRYTIMLIIFREDMKERMYTPEFSREIGGRSSLDWMLSHYRRADLREEIDRRLNCDVETYLPGDLLPKVDRTTMAVGLEGRSPLLDHQLMEFAASLPTSIKFPEQRLKGLLKDVAAVHLGREFVERKKHGFSTPMEHWFRGGMRDLMRDLLLSERAMRRGIFRPEFIQRIVREHESHRVNHRHRIWALMCLEMWFRVFEK